VAARLLALKMTGVGAVARMENARATGSGFFVCRKTDRYKAGVIPAMVT